MLMDLKGYLTERRCASLSEIARHFAADPDAVRPMLELWVRKGKVHRVDGQRCGGCTVCPGADFEIYEWADKAGSERPPTTITPSSCSYLP